MNDNSVLADRCIRVLCEHVGGIEAVVFMNLIRLNHDIGGHLFGHVGGETWPPEIPMQPNGFSSLTACIGRPHV